MELDLRDVPLIEQVNNDGDRYYVTPEGKHYPSVTRLVGEVNKKHIDAWRKRVGEAEANKISTRAAGNGTRFHDLMEKTIKTGPQTLDLIDPFASVYPLACQQALGKVGKVFLCEGRMWSDEMECAGTVDLLAEFDGKICVCDWKTASHEKYAEDVISYWLQTAAYAIMAKERLGLDVEGLALFINETNSSFYILRQPAAPWMAKFREFRKKLWERDELPW